VAKDASTIRQLRILLALLPFITACSAVPVQNHPFIQSLIDSVKTTSEAPDAPLSTTGDPIGTIADCQGSYCGQSQPTGTPWLALSSDPALWAAQETQLWWTLPSSTFEAPPPIPQCTANTQIADTATLVEQQVATAAAAELLQTCESSLKQLESSYNAVNHGLFTVENALLTRMMAMSDQDRVITRLQMALLEQEAQLQQITLEQQATIQEMVRTQAKLMSRNTRADTAALMAETTMTLQKAQALARPNQADLFERSHQLMKQASVAFEAENYDSAAFLARQSVAGIQSFIIQNSYAIDTSLEQQVDQLFAIPLTMNVIESSPIMALPSKESSVIATVEPTDQLTAVGYKGTWVKVQSVTAAEVHGWVFYRRLELHLPQDGELDSH